MLKWLVRFIAYLLGILLLAIVLAYVTGYSYLIKGIKLTYLSGFTSAHIYDGNGFDKSRIDNGSYISALPHSSQYNLIDLPDDLKTMLEKTESTSFIVLRNDSIIWEHYFLNHTDSLRTNSFSMAKTITTLLVEKAIEEGLIPGWDAKAVEYLPWLGGVYAKELTLKHLSCMTAGLDWEESYYDPFGITARAYYDSDIESVMHRVSVVFKPGESYIYQSGATQLLGLCLRKALNRSISEYASEKLWKIVGAESPAFWHTDDKNGMELTYCCFNAVSRDFARLGRLIFHKGKWDGRLFIDSSFFQTATLPGIVPWYGQSFWTSQSAGVKWYMLHGAHGQFIIVVPEKKLVIVRTGYKIKKNRKGKVPLCSSVYAAETISRLGQ